MEIRRPVCSTFLYSLGTLLNRHVWVWRKLRIFYNIPRETPPFQLAHLWCLRHILHILQCLFPHWMSWWLKDHRTNNGCNNREQYCQPDRPSRPRSTAESLRQWSYSAKSIRATYDSMKRYRRSWLDPLLPCNSSKNTHKTSWIGSPRPLMPSMLEASATENRGGYTIFCTHASSAYAFPSVEIFSFPLRGFLPGSHD